MSNNSIRQAQEFLRQPASAKATAEGVMPAPRQPKFNWTIHPFALLPDGHAAAWDSLNAKSGNLPFLETRFLLPLVQELAAQAPRLALCHDGRGVPLAAALLQQAGFGQWETFQPSQLPLGAWLVAPGDDGVQLARALLQSLPALRLGLSQQDPRLHARPAGNALLGLVDYIDTAWIDVSGDFDRYWEARGKNLRSNMRKQRSKLEADGIKLQFDRIKSPELLDEAMAEYGRLETASWKAETGTALHPDNAQGRFYTAMMRHFFAAGRGEIWRLSFDGKAVAMDLCISSEDTLVILKTAYDSSLHNISPAFLLKQEAFRQLFNEGQWRRIEFYGRVMDWHTKWTCQSRRLYHANFDRWGWVGQLQKIIAKFNRTAAASPAEQTIGPA